MLRVDMPAGSDLTGLTVSIVSHGHGAQVASLLAQLGQLHPAGMAKVVLTVNAPELDAGVVFADAPLAERLNLQLLRNTQPLGFGANHNNAFTHCTSPFFCVMNPDITFPRPHADGHLDGQAAMEGLLEALARSRAGIAYPVQVDSQGIMLDFERELVTPLSLWKRYSHIGYLPLFGVDSKNDHRHGHNSSANASTSVHWVSGALMVFKSSVYAQLGGFDERYFLYCEDVDICLRIQLAGYTMERCDVPVVHDTQRRSLKSARHLAWHLLSLWRLWRSRAYLDFLQFLAKKM